MSGTVTGLDLGEVADAASDLLGMCSEAGYRECVDILVRAVPSLLAAARAVQRVEALLEKAESDQWWVRTVDGSTSPSGWFTDQIRAALGGADA